MLKFSGVLEHLAGRGSSNSAVLIINQVKGGLQFFFSSGEGLESSQGARPGPCPVMERKERNGQMIEARAVLSR